MHAKRLKEKSILLLIDITEGSVLYTDLSGASSNEFDSDEERTIDEDQNRLDFDLLGIHSRWKKIQLLKSRLVSVEKICAQKTFYWLARRDWAWRNCRFKKFDLAKIFSLLSMPE